MLETKLIDLLDKVNEQAAEFYTDKVLPDAHVP